MEPKSEKKKDNKKQESKQKAQKRAWDTLPLKEAMESLYLRPELMKKKAKTGRRHVLGKGNLTQQQIIEDIRERFRKFKDSSEFKAFGVNKYEQEIFKLDSALGFLARKLNAHEDAAVPKKIYRAYKLANNFSLGDISRVESQFDMKLLKRRGSDINLEISSDICRLAMQPKLKTIPYKIRSVIANCIRWGLEKTREKLSIEEKIDLRENLVPNSIEFRMLKDERKKLEVSKKMEIAFLERKVPGVLKFAEQEAQRRKQKVANFLYNFRKGQSSLTSDKKNIEYVRGYHKPVEQIEYEKICLFYDEKFTRLDKKFKNLVNKRAKKIENNEYGSIWDNMLFKNSVWKAIEPQTIQHMNALQNIVGNYNIYALSPADNNEDKTIIGHVRSFSEEALNDIWEAETG